MSGSSRVANLLDNPKKAVITLSIPLFISILAQTLNSVIDGMWVSGLGPTAVAATGFIAPVLLIINGFGNGLGIGATSAVSKHIGADDKKGADAMAFQSILVVITVGIVLSLFLMIFREPIVQLLGAGDSLNAAIEYATPIFLGITIILAQTMFFHLLRSEGDTKRGMYVVVLSIIVNLVMDPIFIYAPNELSWLPIGLGLGVAGAAWATILSASVALLIELYWFFFSKSTYIDLSHHKVRFDRRKDYELFKVGIPASFAMIFTSVCTIVLNIIIISGDGTYVDNVAINSCVNRVMMLFMTPIFAFGGTVVPIFGAAYGAGRYEVIRIARRHIMMFCLASMLVLMVLTFLFSEQIVSLFTSTDSMKALRPVMAEALRIMSLSLPFIALGYISSGFFHALGMGTRSLAGTVIKESTVLIVTFALTFVSMSMSVLIWGICVGKIVGAVIVFIWGTYMLHKLLGGKLAKFDAVANQ